MKFFFFFPEKRKTFQRIFFFLDELTLQNILHSPDDDSIKFSTVEFEEKEKLEMIRSRSTSSMSSKTRSNSTISNSSSIAPDVFRPNVFKKISAQLNSESTKKEIGLPTALHVPIQFNYLFSL